MAPRIRWHNVLVVGISLYLLLVSAAASWLLWGWPRVHRGRPAGTAGDAGEIPRQPRAQVHAARRWAGGWHAAGLAGAAAVTLWVAVPLLAAWGRMAHRYDGFDHTTSHPRHPQIAALLEGEQLVPPAPLPPALFLSPDVTQASPAVAGASRDWMLLDAGFRQRLLVAYRLMREQHGFDMVLLEGYRSPQRQAELAAMGAHVTHAGPGQSYHQRGLAADSAFLIDGRVVISERDPRIAGAYELFGRVAEQVGLEWGGSWRSLKDLGHVELRPGRAPERPA
ncbi:MAG: M15 family metallopeptidase [Burkholderiales bacterium]|nr:M15 family metallopeptidase [Burkholderiales bacterium]